MTARAEKFDALVVGGGVAGLSAALSLADQGKTVAVVEKDASIGGAMIRLSKVFPTLDCASCITTPKMAAAAHHENIRLFTFCDLLSLDRQDGKVLAKVHKRPRFVDEAKCIGCRKCEYACPVYLEDPEQGGFTAKKAISIPFGNAIPQVAVLDAQSCALCGKCARVCPTNAVDYLQQPVDFEIEARTVIMATGFSANAPQMKPEYGQGRVENVITALAMERLLAPHGPYMRVLRPGDGKEPGSIAFVQCAGSRDKTLGVPYCSRVCCMAAVKQAMLLSGALPIADITVYYMDIRAFGKNHEQFFQNARAMGIEFVRAKPARIFQGEDLNVVLRYEDQETGAIVEREHELVVLSLGMTPHWDGRGIAGLHRAPDGFLQSPAPKTAPALTTLPGVFAAGAALGPKDIVDTIVEADAAAAEAATWLEGAE